MCKITKLYYIVTDTYVKVYLVKGKKCVEKHRTKTIKESLQPKYMEMLKFKSSPAGCLIQVCMKCFFKIKLLLFYCFDSHRIDRYFVDKLYNKTVHYED